MLTPKNAQDASGVREWSLNGIGRLDKSIWAAGTLALLLLIWVAATSFKIPEWGSHLATSIVVVAIVHFVDRFVLMNETRASLNEMGREIVDKVEASLNGILVNHSASLSAMEKGGIRKIYASRADASPAIANALTAANSEIRIMGISLNDFLAGHQAALKGAWSELNSLIHGKKALPIGRSLTIKILIIDPLCFGGQLRSFAEQSSPLTTAGRLESDVRNASEALLKLEQKAAELSDTTRVCFEARVYRLAPTMFLCHVDNACFVQQYHFWTNRQNDTPVPTLEYAARPPFAEAYPMHKELKDHFDLIWNHSSVEVAEFLGRADVGDDYGVGQCALTNIYTDRKSAETRMVHLLRNAKHRILVQGISLKSFFTPTPIGREVLGLSRPDRSV